MKRIFALIIVALLFFTGSESIVADEANSRDGGELVIVLDPGHDSTHAGAGGNGVREEKAVLKIGLYLKEELSKYENVSVYMTREGEACAFPNTIGVSEGSKRCNEARVAYAQSVGADVIVSLHLNSFTSTSPNGVLAFVQNNNYDANAGAISQNLGKSIVDRIAELGLANGGIVQKDSDWDTVPEEYYYADGSMADYYRVLRYAKKVNIPALIVEHAFVSNASDVQKVLSSEDGLKALALKDAQGIVDYYGLSLKEECVAGELPDISTVPDTQPKPTPEPTPTPTPTPDTEVEDDTQTEDTEVEDTQTEDTEVTEDMEVIEDTEVTEDTETIPGETEAPTESEEEDTEGNMPATGDDSKPFNHGSVVFFVIALIGVCATIGYAIYDHKNWKDIKTNID